MHSEIKPSGQSKPSFIETARRAQIIECAIDAIAELGFAQASLAQIAKRAGVSTGVILYYFAGKDELIRAVGAHVFATGADLISPPVNAQPTARAALRVHKVQQAAKNLLPLRAILRHDAGRPGPWRPAERQAVD